MTEKEKIQKLNNNSNQLIMSTKGNKIKNNNKSYGNNNIFFPPKKQNKNFINVSCINKSSKISLRKSKLNKKVKIIKNKVNKQNNKHILSNINLNNTIKISYNDYELNNFDYRKAILYDKRSCCDYYFSLINRKIPLIFSFSLWKIIIVWLSKHVYLVYLSLFIMQLILFSLMMKLCIKYMNLKENMMLYSFYQKL